MKSLILRGLVILFAALVLTLQADVYIPKEPKPRSFEFSGNLDTAPVLRFFPRTEFPPILTRSHLSGKASIGFQVTAEGHVTEVQVLECTHEVMGACSMATVARMVFHPAKKDGKVVSVDATVTFIFEYESSK